MYIVEMKHNCSAEADLRVSADMDEATQVAHDFFLDYGFVLVENPSTGLEEAFDGGNELEPGGPEGWACFQDVLYRVVDGHRMVAEFSHCHGDGPQVRIIKG